MTELPDTTATVAVKKPAAPKPKRAWSEAPKEPESEPRRPWLWVLAAAGAVLVGCVLTAVGIGIGALLRGDPGVYDPLPPGGPTVLNTNAWTTVSTTGFHGE